MSDPVSCLKSTPCSLKPGPYPKCLRMLRAVLVCWSLALVLTIAGLTLALVQGREGSPKPAPSTSAPADPSKPPTKSPTPTSTPSDPTPSGTPCNIFDPECPGTTGGSITGGAEA